MSWSFNATGKPAAVIAKLKTDLTRNKCVEPEESIKSAVIAIVEQSLSGFPEDHPVEVSASGSQSSPTAGKPVNQLKLDIKPIWNYLV